MFKTMSSSTPAYLNDLIHTAVPVRPLRSSDAPLLIVSKREQSLRVGLFRSRLRTLGTHYHPTLDTAVLWTPSNDTSRPIFSDSLNLTPQAPLYLRTLWRYTNAVIIIIIFILFTGTRKYERSLSRLMHDDLHWLVIPQRVQYKLAVTVHRCLQHRAPWYLVDYCVPNNLRSFWSPASVICQMSSTVSFMSSILGPVHFLLPDQQSGIHCLIICAI